MTSVDAAGRRPMVVVEAPAHPVDQLQGPFEESMLESQGGQPDEIDVPLDATSRRTLLLEAPTYQRVIAGRWKQKKGEKYHPLWKLVAQMSFGIHLLVESMARSEEDVFQILQTHVDDIDIFLERTTEDFALAQEDIQERLKYLKLPLQHPDVFDRMLEDRAFRNSIVDGNEKIEHIVTRTGCAMKDALKDVRKGFDSTSALERYLNDLQTAWTRSIPEHEAVFLAMLGNVEGWKKAFLDLHMQGNELAGSLRKLTDVINQMQQRAGEVSRRLIHQQQRQGGSMNGSNNITYISHQQSNSRSSSRQQTSPSPLAAKKPLPAPASRASSRQHSRNHSNEYAQDQRAGTSQSQRSGTSQSMRSGTRTETPAFRAQSRNDTSMSVRGNEQNSTSSSTPRLVYVTSPSGHYTKESQTTPVQHHSISTQAILEESDIAEPLQAEQSRPGVPKLQVGRQASNISTVSQEQPTKLISRNFVPVELPAELPPTAFLQAPMSNTNRMSTSLGILPSERRAQAQSKGFNPTTALIELLSDPSRYSRLPSTPNSARSPGAALAALEGQRSLVTQTQQQVVLREPTSDQTPPKLGGGGAIGNSPIPPAWGSRPRNAVGSSRVVDGKISSSDIKPNGMSASPVKDTSARNVNKPLQLKTSLYGSLNSSGRITPIPEISTSEQAPSELSTGVEHEIPKLLRQDSTEAMTLANLQSTQAAKKKKLSFVAELPGSEPIFLPSTVYTPTSADTDAPMTYELEAPYIYFNLPPRPVAISQSSTSVSELSGTEDERSSVKAGTLLSVRRDVDQSNTKLGEAIRETITTARHREPEVGIIKESREIAAVTSSDHQRTPKQPSRNRMSAKIEVMADMIHQPSFTPPESPSPERQASTRSRNSAMLDDHRDTTNHIKSVVAGGAPPIPEESESTQPILEVTRASEDRLPSTIRAISHNQVINTDETASSPIATTRPTSERPKSPFPLKLNVIATKADSESTRNSPTLKTPMTPSSIDLARSNTQDSRKKWKAFFGQRKSPTIATGSATNKSPSSLQSASSKRSPGTLPHSATFGNFSLRPKASRDALSKSPKTHKDGEKSGGMATSAVSSPLVKADKSNYGLGINGSEIVGGGDRDHDRQGSGVSVGTDHHSIVDDYV